MRAMLRRWLSHSGGGEFEITEIVTACGEAATNAIEHAGERARCPSWSPELRDGRVEISVRDQGLAPAA